VHGILTSDILMKNIYCYVAEEGYAARVQDTRSYESIRYGFLKKFPLSVRFLIFFLLLPRNVVKTFCRDGRSRSFRTTITQEGTSMNTLGGIDISQGTTQSF